MRSPLHLLRAVPAAVLVLAAAQAGAQSYTFTDLGVLAGTTSSGRGINAAGDVVGRSTIADGSTSAASWKNGSASDLGSLGAGGGIAFAVNDAGQAAGSSRSLPAFHNHATLWAGNAVTDLGTLGGTDSFAYALNNAGQAVGYSTIRTNNAIAHAVLWDAGQLIDLNPAGYSASVATGINLGGRIAGYAQLANTRISHAVAWGGAGFTDLGTLGGVNSQATGINDAGQVVGVSDLVQLNVTHAVLWNGLVATDLGTLGGRSSAASAINSAGQVVGSSNTAGNLAYHAALWNAGAATDLNSFLDAAQASTWDLQFAFAINAGGSITGQAVNNFTHETHAYLLSAAVAPPVPEPTSLALMLAGLGATGLVLRRRRT